MRRIDGHRNAAIQYKNISRYARRASFIEGGNIYYSLRCKALSMKLYALDLMKRFSRQITLAAIRATNDGNIFYNQQISAFAITFAHAANAHPFPSAATAYHSFHCQTHITPCSSETRTLWQSRRILRSRCCSRLWRYWFRNRDRGWRASLFRV